MQNLKSLNSNQNLGGGDSVNVFQKLYSYITGLSDLVAYYPFNELSGNAINNAPDNLGSLDGTLNGPTQGQAGKVGSSYSFDGSNDIVTVSNNALLNFTTTGVTLMAFVRPTTGGDTIEEILKKDFQYIFRLESGAPRMITWADAGNEPILADSALTDDVWSMVAAVYDDSATNSEVLYVNGSEVKAENTQSGALDSGSANLEIGDQSGGGEAFSGHMQHLAVFQRGLTPTEISDIYNIAFG